MKRLQKECREKVDYPNASLAWEDAFVQSIKHEHYMEPYKCPLGDHFHLSSKHTTGDGSHIPPQYREMMLLIGENYETRLSTWQRLRFWLIGI